MKKLVYKLTVNRCPAHPDYWAICLEDTDGGQRLTSSKCCGQWNVISRKTGEPSRKGPWVEFPMSVRQLEEVIDACQHAIERLQAVGEAPSRGSDD